MELMGNFVPYFKDGFFESATSLMQDYQKYMNRLTRNPLDYNARNRLIDLLSTKCCEGISYESESWETSFEAEHKRKIEAFRFLREISGFYRQKRIGGSVQAERLQLWSILKDAQCSLFVGECIRALQCYKEALSHPVIVRAIHSMDKANWWTDEFSFNDAETILKIVYNMAQIFEWMDLGNKAASIYEKYNNIIRYKCDSVYRISLKENVTADTKERIQKDADILCGFTKGENKIYILGKAHYFTSSERSLMDIGFEHPEEPFRIDIDEEILFDDEFDEILFHDDIYETGIARINVSSDDFDIQRRKARILI